MRQSARWLFTALLLMLSAWGSYAQVVAGFTAAPSSGCAPLVVHFTNTSTPVSGTTYTWNLDNGSGIITLTNPSASYLAAGVYTVTLTATNGSASATATRTITVYPAPAVNFTVSDTLVCPGVPITFTSTTVAGVPGAVSYVWSFGDGDTATAATVTHAILFPGYFNITLNATNAEGCSSSLTRSSLIHIWTPPAPSFSVGSPHLCPNGTETFTSTVTGSGPFTYSWNFGDGSPPSGATNPSHVYVAPGSYNVTLTVTDVHHCSTTVTVAGAVAVNNMIAAFHGPDTACIHTAVTFNNTSTSYLSNLWIYGNGTTGTSTTGHATYDSAGTYTVKLVTYDGTCRDTVAHSIYIPSPVSSFTITPALPCPAPVNATFAAQVPYGGTVTWNFGDTTFGAGFPTTHFYPHNGLDTVHMYVTYAVGCRDTVTQLYKIYDMLFTETNFSPAGGCIPVTALFGTIAHSSFDSIAGAFPPFPYPYTFTYAWNFGDGSPIDTTPVSVYHTFTTVGVFHITLTATSSNGCVVVRHDTMSAGVPPVDTFEVSPLHQCFSTNKYDRTRYITHLLSGHITSVFWIHGEGLFGGYESDTTTKVTDTFYHHYSLPGVFRDTLISYYNGCPDTFIGKTRVTIDSPESRANFPILCTPHNTVDFEDGSFGDDTHLWVFGDGATSALDTVVHTYAAAAHYTALLETYNVRSGCRDTQSIFLDLTRPVFSFRASDTAICRDAYTTFTSTLTSGYVLSYEWYVGGLFLGDSSIGHLVDTFHSTGRYTTTLITLDQHLCPDTVTRTNYILVAKPADHFNISPPGICWPNPATFTDVSVDQPGTFMTNFNWKFGDTLSATVTTPAVTHTYTAAGAYSVTEIVTDNVGCKDTLTHTVSDYHPMASYTQSATHVCAYTNVIFSNTSTPGGASFHWTFGDGNISTAVSPAHAYSDTGYFTVKMIMMDPHGCSDSATSHVRVTKPHAAFSMSDSVAVCPPFLVHFTNLSTGGISNRWRLDNGDSSLAVSPSFIYPAPAYDTVRLIVTDSANCTDTAFAHVKIYGYSGDFSYSPYSGCAPMIVNFNADLSNIALATAVIWDFSDGTVSSGLVSDTISHTYAPGFYVPRLIVKGASCVDTSRGADTIKADAVRPGFSIGAGHFCPGDTIRLADTSTSYWSHIIRDKWTYNGDTSSLPSPYVIYTVSGVYPVSLNVTDAWGCTGAATGTVTVNPLPNAGIITSNLVNEFCIGYKFEVQDTAAGGVWGFSNDHVSLSDDTITAVSPGLDTLTYSVTNGCGTAVAVDTFRVAPPLPPISGRLAVCVGDTSILRDSVFGGMWQGGGPHATVSSSLSDSGIVAGISAGTETLTYQMDLGCFTTAIVTVDPLPDVSIADSQIKCYGENSGSIAITPTTENPSYRYYWSNGSNAAAITGLPPGVYSVLIKDTALGCRVSKTFQISMPDSLSIRDSVSNDICFSPNGSISVTASGGTQPYAYEWSNKASSSTVSGLTSGQYALLLTDFNGCFAKYYFVLSDSLCPYIVIHNAISPNGDGLNETWVIEHIENFPKNTVYVFDKWGDEIFRQEDYKNDWYGVGKNGKEVPDGTYYYLVKINADYVTGQQNVFKGTLLIKR